MYVQHGSDEHDEQQAQEQFERKQSVARLEEPFIEVYGPCIVKLIAWCSQHGNQRVNPEFECPVCGGPAFGNEDDYKAYMASSSAR
jgi:hypothetical protein